MTKRLFGFILSVCLLLTSLPVAALPVSDPLPQSEELWAYERQEDGVTLTDYLGTDAHVFVPDVLTIDGTEYPVTRLGDDLFGGNQTITHVTLGRGITQIGDRAFRGATHLATISVGEALTSIGKEAFLGCTSLTAILVGKSVSQIGDNAFSACPDLTLYLVDGTYAHTYASQHAISYTIASSTDRKQLCAQGSITYCFSDPSSIHQAFVYQSVAEAPNAVEYYGRSALAKLNNATALLYAYDQITAGVEVSAIDISVYDGITPISVDQISAAFYAMKCDRPDFFWLGSGYSCQYNYRTVLTLSPLYDISDDLDTAKAAFDSVAEEIMAGITPDMTDFEKELYLHDTIAARVEYIETANAHNAYGALVEGKAVCDGYAESLQYFLQRVGINSFIVTGGNHAWNLVEIDGNWYHTDLTWNDQESIIFHTYFNVTDAEITRDHTIEPTLYAYPSCTTTDAFYFNVMGGILTEYTVYDVAAHLKDNDLSAIFYVPYGAVDFISWCNSNMSAIAKQLGINGCSYSYQYIDREVSLIISTTDTVIPRISYTVTGDIGSMLTVSATMSDNQTVAGYFWGPDPVPANNPYHSLETIAASVTHNITVADSGTYYLTAKDAYGNHSETISLSFVKTLLNEGDDVTTVLRPANAASFVLPTLEKDNFQFLGWSSAENATEAEYDAGATYSGTTDATLFAVWVQPSDPYTEGLIFTKSDDTYTVTGYTGTEANVIIPAIYKGLPVTAIGERAFYNCDSLTSVTIPDSVTTIGEWAFYGCSGLTSVTIPDSVTSIGSSAFSYCSSLTEIVVDEENEAYCSIDGNLYTKDGKTLVQYAIGKPQTSFTIPDSVTSIGSYAFCDCSSLTSVTIGNGVTSIGSYAFAGCSGLTSVTIGDSVTTIGEWAFCYCPSLTSVTIGDSVTTIGRYAFLKCSSLTSVTIGDSVTTIENNAFSACTSLTSVTIPDSVTTIGDSAFSACYSLTEIVVDEENEAYCSIDGNLYTKDGKTLVQYAIGKPQTSFTIPDSVTGIGDYAFCDCSSLTSVTIPDSVTSIGYYAFSDCTRLTSVTIPDSVTTIGDDAFYHCTSLTSVTIGDSVTTIGERAFYCCWSLTNVTIPDSVTSIGYGAFEYCDSLTSVTIPDSVTIIGDYAFCDCSSLTSVTILSETVEIYDSANTISNTATIYGYEGSTAEAYATNYNRRFVKILASGTCGAEGDYVTWLVTENGELIISGTGDMADFDYNASPWESYCSLIHTVDVKNGITGIGEFAFSSCRSLTSVTIGDSVASIENTSFTECENISYNVYENGLYWGNHLNPYHAFVGVSQYDIATIEFHPGTKIILSDSLSRTALETVEIPEGVISIGEWAFASCEQLVSVSIPSSVLVIGDLAFAYCPNLRVITVDENNPVFYMIDGCLMDITNRLIIGMEGCTLPSDGSITHIGNGAFAGQSMSEMVVPEGIVALGNGAFAMCENLVKITLPESLTYIGGEAFAVCSALTEITIPKNVTQIDDYVLTKCDNLEKVVILSKTVEIYDSAKTISDTATIYGYEGSTAEAYAEKYGRTFVALSEYRIGDMNGDEKLDSDDAIYLLRYTFLPNDYPIYQNGDLNNDGQVNSDDAIYLLRHTFLPDQYPLSK